MPTNLVILGIFLKLSNPENELQKSIKIDCPASLKSEISGYSLNILCVYNITKW